MPQEDENIIMKNYNPVHINDESSDNISVNSSNSSMKQLKIEQLFRTVSIPDEQVPGLNHLVNRPQSWVPQPRSKRPTRGILFISKSVLCISGLELRIYLNYKI